MRHRPFSIGTTKKMIAMLMLGFVAGYVPQFPVLAQEEEPDIPAYTGRPPEEHPMLAPCSRYDERYEGLGFTDTSILKWPDRYHNRVDGIVEEYLKPMELTCGAQDYTTFMKPGPELSALAQNLPTWSDGEVPLSRFDTARVLLEHLRVYECAMKEFYEFRSYDTAKEEFFEEFGGVDTPSFFDYFFSNLMVDTRERSDVALRELIVARRALNRVLTLIGAFDRLRPLDAELECMQRISLDMRNISALSAETSACLPRTWNAKDPLRDYPEKEE